MSRGHRIPGPSLPQVHSYPDTVVDSHFRKDQSQLEGPAQSLLTDQMGTEICDLLTLQKYLPGSGLQFTRDDIEKGGLPGAIGPDDSPHLSFLME